MAISLDRLSVEDAGADPLRLARAIHRQLPDLTGAVPVHDIAHALDIEEIRAEPLRSFEGCLLTDRHKSYGSILVNATSSARRQRYTIGHELGHFLNERHMATGEDGFQCTREDMAHPRRSGTHLRQEREANMFAIELLAPERLLQAHLQQPADLEHALAIAENQNISREAAVRRYVALHDECLAVVFSRAGRVRYVEKGETFPATAIWANDAMPALPRRSPHGSNLTALDEVIALPWLTVADDVTLFIQTLYQAEEYAMTLLLFERDEGPAGQCGS